jgi:hypothetical protein
VSTARRYPRQAAAAVLGEILAGFGPQWLMNEELRRTKSLGHGDHDLERGLREESLEAREGGS